jgi:hypothetical protein
MIDNILIYHLYFPKVIIKIKRGAFREIIRVEFGLNTLVSKYH